MRLLQKYPWLVPDDGGQWVAVEASSVMDAIAREVGKEYFWAAGMPIRPPWKTSIIEFKAPIGLRPIIAAACTHYDSEEGAKEAWSAFVRPIIRDRTIRHDLPFVPEAVVIDFLMLRSGQASRVGGCFMGINDSGHRVFRTYDDGGVESARELIEGSANTFEITDFKARNPIHTVLSKYLSEYVAGVFAFLNCKNVTVIDEDVPAAVRKKRARKGRDIIYKQLVVDGKPIVRRPGQQESKEDAD